MGEDEIEARFGHVFEGDQGGRVVALQPAEQGERGLGRGQGGEGGDPLGGRRLEAKDGGGDDAERALGADEELAQAIAGIVLAQGSEPVPDAAVRQHDLEPEHALARVAVAERVVAAGVGGKHAADLGGPFRADRERQQAGDGSRRVLGGLERDPGLKREGEVERVDRADARESREAEDELGAVRGWHGATDHRCVAALRHDGDMRAGAEANACGDFRGAGRPQNGCGPPVIEAAPVGGVGGGVGRVGEHPAGAESRGKRRKQAGRDGSARGAGAGAESGIRRGFSHVRRGLRMPGAARRPAIALLPQSESRRTRSASCQPGLRAARLGR